jgi:hypothetical protein
MSAGGQPERWLTADEELAARLRPALRMARTEGPSATAHERMWGALAGQLPLVPGGQSRGDSPNPVPAAPGSGAGVAEGSSSTRWWAAGIGLGAAVIGISAALFASIWAPVPSATPAGMSQPRVTRADHKPSPVEETVVKPSEAPSNPTAVSGRAGNDRSDAPRGARSSKKNASRSGAMPAGVIDSKETSPGFAREFAGRSNLRRSVDSGAYPSQRRAGSGTAREPSPDADLSRELDLLARARRVVARDPARALQLTAEHGRNFQDGVLAQEREVLAIDALTRLGHRDLAVARARRFIERYPDSAHRVRLAAELAPD